MDRTPATDLTTVPRAELLLLRKLARLSSALLINPHDPRYAEGVREVLAELEELRRRIYS